MVEDEATVLLIRIATSKRKPRKRGIILYLNYEVMGCLFVDLKTSMTSKRYSTRQEKRLFIHIVLLLKIKR